MIYAQNIFCIYIVWVCTYNTKATLIRTENTVLKKPKSDRYYILSDYVSASTYYIVNKEHKNKSYLIWVVYNTSMFE